MSGTDENKPAAKSGRRSKKGEARRQKVNLPEAPVQLQSPEPEQEQAPQVDLQPAADEPLEAVVAEAMTAEPIDAEADIAEANVAEPDVAPADAPSPAEAALRKARESADLTQAEVADKLGLYASFVSKDTPRSCAI